MQLDKGDEQRRDFKGIYAECAAVLRQVRLPCHAPPACSLKYGLPSASTQPLS